MQDYQKTLNLPNTSFSMKAGLAQKEPQQLEEWEKEKIYSKIREKCEGKKQFILHDGPPYANGNIHIGHALNKVLKDMIVKFRTMQDYDTLFIPGWDCHGLPIEHQLLKELKKDKSQVDCVDFRKKAHDYAMKYVGIQREQFKRLGIFAEWDNPYLTLDTEYEYWILKSLGNLNEKGYIYRGLKPVNWCSKCETALAEAEVEYEDHTSPSVYVKFKVINKETLGLNKDLFLLVWTTTPWTLIANVAVALQASFNYSVIDLGDHAVIVEESLAGSVFEKAGITDFKKIKKVKGDELTKLIYEHPFGTFKECKVVAADYVTKEDGTGLVHTAPGHGQDDYLTGLKYDLEIFMPVDNRGIYTEKGGKYAGMHVFKANAQIIDELKQKGVLFASENITHSYPHCWRCKSPIIFRATDQWFFEIDHDNLRGRLKEVIKNNVQWIPEAGQERILAMISQRPDWCLSRQRYWGVPIPALECEGCKGEHKLFTQVINHFADIVKKEGSNAWFEKDVKELVPEGFVCPDCGKAEFKKTNDILDVWFDSGVSNQAVVKARMKREIPIELYLEGSDQHRGWFQSSIIPSVAIENKAPFKAVLTHGFVVDGQGRKMSKSLGNVISPLDIIKNSGADILRLWIAASSYNEDIRISQEIMDRLIDAYRKIRNTFRFLLGNLNGFDPEKEMIQYDDLFDLDKWALCKLSETVVGIKKSYENYEFSKAYKLIYSFCNEVLSSFYLDILKDRLYTSSAFSRKRKSAQTVLYYVVDNLVRLMAPILSFTSEEIFKSMPKDAQIKEVMSVHLLSWPDDLVQWGPSGPNKNINEKFDILVRFRPYVLKALEDKRRTGEIGSSLEAKVIIKSASQRDLDYFNEFKEMLPSIFIVSQVEIVKCETLGNSLGEEFPKTEIIIEKAEGQKCSRCWNYFKNLGTDSEHPTLCINCTEIVKEYK